MSSSQVPQPSASFPSSFALASVTIDDTVITGLRSEGPTPFGPLQLGADEGGAIALNLDNGLTAFLGRLTLHNNTALRGGAFYLSDDPARTVTGAAGVRPRAPALPVLLTPAARLVRCCHVGLAPPALAAESETPHRLARVCLCVRPRRPSSSSRPSMRSTTPPDSRAGSSTRTSAARTRPPAPTSTALRSRASLS